METTQEFFEITTTVRYSPWRTPPRCRKPRQVDEEFTLTSHIPSVTAADALVVARIPNHWGLYNTTVSEFIDLRTFGGKLFAPLMNQTASREPYLAVTAGDPTFPDHRELTSWGTTELSEAESKIRAEIEPFIVVDGFVWREVEEPVLAVSTLGMGGNHGSTVFQYETVALETRRDSSYFSITDYDAAVAAAVKVAEGRGDTESIDRIKELARPEILDAGVFKILLWDERLRDAENKVRDLIWQSTHSLSKQVTRENIQKAKDLMETADEVMYDFGIKEMER